MSNTLAQLFGTQPRNSVLISLARAQLSILRSASGLLTSLGYVPYRVRWVTSLEVLEGSYIVSTWEDRAHLGCAVPQKLQKQLNLQA